MKDKAVNIIKANAPDIENYRARDVEFLLKGHVEPRVLKVLCGLAEKNHFLEKTVAELSSMQMQVIDLVSQFSDVADNMKGKMESIEKTLTGEDVGDSKDN